MVARDIDDRDSVEYVFIADFFADQIPAGGAELNDAALLAYLEENGGVYKSCSNITTEELRGFKDKKIIVGNRVFMTTPTKLELATGGYTYVVYEHDCQFDSNRDVSRHPNFVVPAEDVRNRLLYEKALRVFCLSESHAESLQKSIPGAKVVSIGTSLWTEDQLDTLEYVESQFRGKNRSSDWMIVNWLNPIKGRDESIRFCGKNSKPYELVEKMEWRPFLEELAAHDIFVFHPRVFESFSRVCAEAKMVGCKVATTPKKVGFFSESISSLSGLPLIEAIRERVSEALRGFVSVFNKTQDKRDVTAILTVYRRPHLLGEQIKALREQTYPPKDIFVWVNDHEDNRDYNFDVLGVKVFRANHNWKYHGRFSIAMLAETEHVCIFDDDSIPGESWFENCFDTMGKVGENIILGGCGVILSSPDKYQHHQREGWSNPKSEIVEVDLAGHVWFAKREVFESFWREPMFTTETGEDIHFSAMAQKYLGAKTYVPPHPGEVHSLWSSTKGYEYGVDEVASSRPSNHGTFYGVRDKAVEHYTENGWRIIKC